MPVAYDVAIIGTWFTFVGIPSLVISMAKLRQLLGEDRSIEVKAQTVGRPGRKIPINDGAGGYLAMADERSPIKDVFKRFQLEPVYREPDIDLPAVFQVSGIAWSQYMRPMTVELFDIQVEAFLQEVYDRQISRDPKKSAWPMSRNYFTKVRRPKIPLSVYYALLGLLLAHGAYANRSQGRSGYLTMTPSRAIKQIKYSYLLQ